LGAGAVLDRQRPSCIDGGHWQYGRALCRSDTRRCSSFLTMAPRALSSHHLPSQEPVQHRSFSCSERCGNRQALPPKAMRPGGPMSHRGAHIGAASRVRTSKPPRDHGPCGHERPCIDVDRDGGAGTLAGGPNAPSRSCPPSPRVPLETTRTQTWGRPAECHFIMTTCQATLPMASMGGGPWRTTGTGKSLGTVAPTAPEGPLLLPQQ
jgi:hypothetical protein